MNTAEFNHRVEVIKHRASGHWPDILQRLGIDPILLNRKNQPCPLCGGHDRFQFTDKFAHGNFFCRGCGPGDGFKLLKGVLGLRFGAALEAVESVVGGISSSIRQVTPTKVSTNALMRRIWDEAGPITEDDQAGRYLAKRGLALSAYPDMLRCHPGLGYFVRDEAGRSRQVAQYPALLASVQGPDGERVALHRTYLVDGEAPSGIDVKKLLGGGLQGGAVRLFAPTDVLGLAEGIETALACHLATRKPVWASLGANNLRNLWIPPSVSHVIIYADNDADRHFAGQAAAYALAERLTRQQDRNLKVEVFIPEQPGQDWADVWLQSQPQIRAVA